MAHTRPCTGQSPVFRELECSRLLGLSLYFGCIVAGYLMEHGNLKVLIQPAELIIIGGAAIGTVLVANPLHIIKKIVAGVGGSIWRIEIRQAGVYRHAEDDVRPAEQGAQRRLDGA